MQIQAKTARIQTSNLGSIAPRIAAWLFVMLFACYGYFHQGGNWHQNSRFDQVRSIVENRQLEINEVLRYQVVTDSAGRTRILRVRDPLNIDRRSPPLFANTGTSPFMQVGSTLTNLQEPFFWQCHILVHCPH